MRNYLKHLLFALLLCAFLIPSKTVEANIPILDGFNSITKSVQGYSYEKPKQYRRRRGGDDDDDYHHGDDDDNGDDDGDDDDSNEIPLDGGLSFLAVAGAGLGIKKVRDNMAKKRNK